MPDTNHRSVTPRRISVHDLVFSVSVLSSGALLGLFAVLAVVVRSHHGPFPIDTSAASAFGATRAATSFRLGEAASLMGSGPVVAIVAIIIGLGLLRRTRELYLSGAVPAAAAVSGIIELAVKHLVERPRPPTAILTGKAGYSFPSGHTTGFTAMVVAIVAVLGALVWPRRKVVLGAVIGAVFALAVALSRVVVGAHWATDVIGGLMLGAAVGLGTVVVACGRQTPRSRTERLALRAHGADAIELTFADEGI